MALLSGPFLFLRHGQTKANATDTVCGMTDEPLDATGHAQARHAADHLRANPPRSIWTSDLLRARVTAEIVADATSAALHVLPGLGERDWGAWEGGPRTALVRDAVPPGGGEGPEAFHERVLTALARIAGPGRILIVAHSGTARMIHAHLTDTPFARLGNCQLLEWRDGVEGWRCHTRFVPGC